MQNILYKFEYSMYNINKRKYVIDIITMLNTLCTKRSNISIQIKYASLIKHEHPYKGIITTWTKSLHQQHNSFYKSNDLAIIQKCN
jgi:hypothetical protein